MPHSQGVRPSREALQGSAGGSATAGGVGFEHRATAWVAAHILAEADASAPWELPAEVHLREVLCQAPAYVDDLLVGTSANGWVFIQAKQSLRLEKSARSRVRAALGQLVTQYLAHRDRPGPRPWERALEATRDRLVLLVDSNTGQPLTRHLPAVLRRLADGVTERDCPTNGDETKAWRVARHHVRSIWQKAAKKPPSQEDLRAFASLVRIQRLELDPGGDGCLLAEGLLRHALVRPAEAAAAWRALSVHGQRLAEDRSRADRETLVEVLNHGRIAVQSPRSLRPSIDELRRISRETLTELERHTAIVLADRERVHIKRSLVAPLLLMAQAGPLVLTGEPGAGKSATLAELARRAIRLGRDGRDVVVLAANRLTTEVMPRLAATGNTLVDALKAWTGSRPAFLIIDGFDATREATALQQTQRLLGDILREPGRWRIIVSIRTFDLRWNEELRRLFRGTPHDVYRDQHVSDVRHFQVPRLSTEELQQVAVHSARFSAAIQAAPPALSPLLTVPFNLWLLAQLLGRSVDPPELRRIESQASLLDLFWKQRVRSPVSERSANELFLHKVCERMLVDRRLRVGTAAVATPADAGVMDRIRSSGVLTSCRKRRGAPQDQFLEFEHNILFDFAAAELVLTTDVDRVLETMRREPDLLLFARPSFEMALHELWEEDPSRQSFWDAVLRIAAAKNVPKLGQSLGPAVAADRAASLEDLEPLCTNLTHPISETRAAAILCLRHLVARLTSREAARPGIIAPWPAFTARIATIPVGDVIYPARVLLSELARAL